MEALARNKINPIWEKCDIIYSITSIFFIVGKQSFSLARDMEMPRFWFWQTMYFMPLIGIACELHDNLDMEKASWQKIKINADIINL
jgi:hypothetical protein